jgi:hypothetical protein
MCCDFPHVPIASPHFLKAVERKLISEDLEEVCRIFQTDMEFRWTVVDKEPMFRVRHLAHGTGPL